MNQLISQLLMGRFMLLMRYIDSNVVVMSCVLLHIT